MSDASEFTEGAERHREFLQSLLTRNNLHEAVTVAGLKLVVSDLVPPGKVYIMNGDELHVFPGDITDD